ncbi:multi antimicrobial extrusion protein MatE [Cohnella faecalis]|uniref:Multi antimicrobial extrusion protein MatE n=1 Tax=Cohnella faecalis TaxID=2315694 RepID=A0A398CHI2_9BACL|nr:multi antimicrobial extrusion protein MatE [Cohnella faecalis]RIE00559.1 multi antimicrobial extrusion protein MatE [Cohnella faecalis]
MPTSQEPVTLKKLFLFFIPMGLSVVLINLSHVIINGTLARSANPEMIIAGYALGMSLLTVSERPAVLLRQTCSALVRDQLSYKAVLHIGYYVFGASLVLGALIAYSPLGHLIFGIAYGASADVEKEAIGVFRVLMFLTVFSGLRCFFQGVIIYKMRTRWLTIGMIFRLAGMFAVSQYFIQTGVSSAAQGSMIFVVGMIIEAALSWWECRKLVREMPKEAPDCEIKRPKQVLFFYKPLLYSSLVVVWIMPILNTLLGTTNKATLAVASFSIASSLMNLILGFFTYFHQISLLFIKSDPAQVRKFTLMLGFVPAALIIAVGFTPATPWLLAHVLGVKNELLEASVHAFRSFLPFVLVFPWLDTLNGIVMANGETKLMFASQTANAVVTILVMIVLAILLPSWNGSLGSHALSGGIIAELSVLFWLYRRNLKHKLTVPPSMRELQL